VNTNIISRRKWESTITYTIVDSPVGRVLVAATERGVTSVRMGASDRLLESGLRAEHPGAKLVRGGDVDVAPPVHFSDWVQQIQRYLQGRTTHFDVPRDVPETLFEHRVRDALQAIPYGTTRTYGEVADSVGQPTAARAVAQVCARNPVALVVPCHRVTRQDSLGNYRWGPQRKRLLLEQERAVALRSERSVLRHFVRSIGTRQARGNSAPHGGFPPGAILAGRYRVLRHLGQGGMGTVYLVLDQELDERVALKMLRLTEHRADDAAIQRFKRELRLTRKVSDSHVVRAYDIGRANGELFYTMEHVDGPSIAQVLHDHGALPVNVAMTIGLQLCRALHAVHTHKVVHRDIKPANVLLSRQGEAKLADFGIAELARALHGDEADRSGDGTLPYMAPEQLLGTALDTRVDVFALGVVLYECLTGALPFRGRTPQEHIALVLAGSNASPQQLNSSVPPELSSLVTGTLAADAAARPASFARLHDSLAAVRAGR
jgi:O-6-methylguanine DNA methyltransferase